DCGAVNSTRALATDSQRRLQGFPQRKDGWKYRSAGIRARLTAVFRIKPSAPDSQLKVDFAAGGKLFISNATLRFLIKIAYNVTDDQLQGGPAWINSRRFDLEAKPSTSLGGDPQTMTKEQILAFHAPVRLRLQRLLADRFQLALRKESTPMPLFALVVAKGGPKKLTPSRSADDAKINSTFGRGILTASATDMPSFVGYLSEGQVGRPVVDMTGLTGKYNFHLEWTPDPALNPANANQQTPTDPNGISIFTALQQQLGLKLEPRAGNAERLVVTQAELPSVN
ncbi:MAG TPA: TIGR03435 family protein, partial [Bryobacteraceae bacterium]